MIYGICDVVEEGSVGGAGRRRLCFRRGIVARRQFHRSLFLAALAAINIQRAVNLLIAVRGHLKERLSHGCRLCCALHAKVRAGGLPRLFVEKLG